jgi:outer membrane murein-binding lipoprotein Lpp
MKSRIVLIAALCAAASLLSGCVSAPKSSEYAKSEMGEIMRAEAATILSQRFVTITNFRGAKSKSARRNGVNYIIKIDRTGETLSITQSSDVTIATGGAAWVEFGDKIRLSPRQ